MYEGPWRECKQTQRTFLKQDNPERRPSLFLFPPRRKNKYLTNSGMDRLFKIEGSTTDVLCRCSHKHCCYCRHIDRTPSLLPDIGQLWGFCCFFVFVFLQHDPWGTEEFDFGSGCLAVFPGPILEKKVAVNVCTNFILTLHNSHKCVRRLTRSSACETRVCLFHVSGLFGQKVVFKPSSWLVLQ